MKTTSILEAGVPHEFQAARSLFEEYAAGIEVDLCFQNFRYELDHIREIYGPPGGGLFLACADEKIVGCAGLRPFHAGACEMKRLYVQPAARGLDLGRLLALAVIERARSTGYRRMLLDTLPSMHTALRLYRSLGFRNTSPYYTNPIEGAVYLELILA